jgi:hypothetical protein
MIPRADDKPAFRMRDLPGVDVLEWEVEQHGWTTETEAWAAELSRLLFGIDEDATHAALDERGRLVIGGSTFDDIGDRAIARVEDWEKHFEVLRSFRDEADAYWASVGWDVTDGKGKQLIVMQYLARPLICIIKSLHPSARLAVSEEGSAYLSFNAERFVADRGEG